MKKSSGLLDHEAKIKQLQSRISNKEYVIDGSAVADNLMKKCLELWPSYESFIAWRFPHQDYSETANFNDLVFV